MRESIVFCSTSRCRRKKVHVRYLICWWASCVLKTWPTINLIVIFLFHSPPPAEHVSLTVSFPFFVHVAYCHFLQIQDKFLIILSLRYWDDFYPLIYRRGRRACHRVHFGKTRFRRSDLSHRAQPETGVIIVVIALAYVHLLWAKLILEWILCHISLWVNAVYFSGFRTWAVVARAFRRVGASCLLYMCAQCGRPFRLPDPYPYSMLTRTRMGRTRPRLRCLTQITLGRVTPTILATSIGIR